MPNAIASIKILNADKLISAFNSAPDLMGPALNDAINKSLFTIGGDAARSAPVRTGNLRSSILDPNRGLKLAVSGVFSGSVGSGTGYGLFVELGTRFMRAQPYLQPAVEKNEDVVANYFTNAVDDVLNKIAERTK